MIKEVRTGDVVVAGIKDASVLIGPLVAQKESVCEDWIFKFYYIQLTKDQYLPIREDELDSLWSYTEEEAKKKQNRTVLDDFYDFAKQEVMHNGRR